MAGLIPLDTAYQNVQTGHVQEIYNLYMSGGSSSSLPLYFNQSEEAIFIHGVVGVREDKCSE